MCGVKEGPSVREQDLTSATPFEAAVVVAKAAVEVELSILAVDGGTEDVAVVDADVLSRRVERHDELILLFWIKDKGQEKEPRR